MKQLKKKRFRIKHLLFLILGFVAVTLVIDLIRIFSYEIIPKRPQEKLHNQVNQVYVDLRSDTVEIDWNRMDHTMKYIQGEWDCADFRMVSLVRMMYEYGDSIPADYRAKIDDILLNFRYWWDDPGANSMCYWSENHQILFATAEYLFGQFYPDRIFHASGLTGKEHMEKARIRILDWMEMRWKYGFIEYNSGTYYNEDVGPLMNLIDYARDPEIVKKASIIMDLILYDIAAQNIHEMFVTTSARAYKGNRVGGPHQTMGGITRFYWGDGTIRNGGMTYGNMISRNYQLPPVIKEIAQDTSNVVIKQTNGLNLNELKKEGYYGTDNRSMMMQWGMEAFSNPEVVRNTLYHIRNNIHFSNEFIAPTKVLDFTLLRWLHLEPFLVKLINPQSNGVAIQKGNTYTYKTNDYSMYTSQSYHPGTYGDQHHIFGMNIRNHFSIFHNHPAIEKDQDNQSPNYWVGYGHFPHTVQDKNVNLSIYNLPKKKGLMELDLLDYTRAYFPSEVFDTTIMTDNYVFGEKGNTYCAFIGANDFYYRDDAKDDIIQPGKQSFWICEAGSLTEDGSFENFVDRVKSNPVEFDRENLILTYRSNNKEFELKFKGDFKLNGEVVDTQYSRFDSPYIKAPIKPGTMTFTHNGKSLYLDFYNQIRTIN